MNSQTSPGTGRRYPLPLVCQVWRDARAGTTVNAYRRNLQRAYLAQANHLLNVVDNAGWSPPRSGDLRVGSNTDPTLKVEPLIDFSSSSRCARRTRRRPRSSRPTRRRWPGRSISSPGALLCAVWWFLGFFFWIAFFLFAVLGIDELVEPVAQGIRAAMLAASGFTGPLDVIESRRGFLARASALSLALPFMAEKLNAEMLRLAARIVSG